MKDEYRGTYAQPTWKDLSVVVLIIGMCLVLLTFTGCAGKSYRAMEAQEYLEARACSAAQRWMTAAGYNVAGIPCNQAQITYIDAHAITCGEEETDSSGCFHVTVVRKEGAAESASVAEYDIYIAARHWGWENTLVHEYCHFLLHNASYADWVTPCHQ